MKRSVSFTSSGLALGSFPEKSKVPAPTINAYCIFRKGTCPTASQVAEQVVQPLLEYERMSQVFDETTCTFRPSQQEYTALDLVREVEVVNETTCPRALEETIFTHINDELKEGRNDLPWWEMLLVKSKTGRSAVVLRVHHVIADGLALVHAFAKILKTVDGKPLAQQLKLNNSSGSNSSSADAASSKPQKSFWATLWSLIKATIHVLTLGQTRFDDDTAFSKQNHANMVYTGKRDFILFPDIPLDFVKAIKTVAKVSVNDVLMTAVSQAIYDYCIQQNDRLVVDGAAKKTNIQCRALIPVGFPRTAAQLAEQPLRNQWCMASCDLAVGCKTVVERLQQIHQHATEMKTEPRAYMQLLIQNNVAKWLPKTLARQAVLDVFSRHSLVLTNVPGPPQPCLLAGKRVDGLQLFFDNILSQVSILSYGGCVSGNIVYDLDALPNLANGFGASYARALAHLAQHYKVTVPAALASLGKED